MVWWTFGRKIIVQPKIPNIRKCPRDCELRQIAIKFRVVKLGEFCQILVGGGGCWRGCIEETSCPPYQLLCSVITLLLFRDLVNKAIEEIVHQCIGSSVLFEFNNSFNFGVIFKVLKYVSRTLYRYYDLCENQLAINESSSKVVYCSH